MNYIRMYKTYKELMNNQYLDRDSIRKMQEYKLRLLVKEAYNNVPYYKDLFDDAGISDTDIKTLDDLKIIPITTKESMQNNEKNYYLNKRMAVKDLKSARSSGSTGRPFEVYYDNNYRYIRHATFLRALKTTGYRFGEKILTVTRPGLTAKSNLLFRKAYASNETPTDELFVKLNTFRPDILYGSLTALRELAEYIRDSNTSFFRPKRIITTAEYLDTASRKLLESVFGVDVFDHYGLTELGLVGWECSEHNGFHIAEDCRIIEYLPLGGITGASNLIMTNLEQMAMPFIRYEMGDIGVASPVSPCACGRTFSRLEKVEGKIVDCILLKDGKRVSPFSFTNRLETIKHLKRFQVIQEDYNKITVLAEAESVHAIAVENAINDTITSILGREVTVMVTITDKLIYPRNRKFRVIESKLN